MALSPARDPDAFAEDIVLQFLQERGFDAGVHCFALPGGRLEQAPSVLPWSLGAARLCFVPQCTLELGVALLLRLAELAGPVEMPCWCCIGQGVQASPQVASLLITKWRVSDNTSPL